MRQTLALAALLAAFGLAACDKKPAEGMTPSAMPDSSASAPSGSMAPPASAPN